MTFLGIRKARKSDCWLLLEWENAPETMAGSFPRRQVGRSEHIRWFRGRMADSHTHIWLLEEDDKPVAVARYEQSGSLLEINLTVAPGQHGKGYGTAILEMTAPLAFAESGTDRCRALVFVDNAASRRVFEKAGYRQLGGECVVLERTKT